MLSVGLKKKEWWWWGNNNSSSTRIRSCCFFKLLALQNTYASWCKENRTFTYGIAHIVALFCARQIRCFQKSKGSTVFQRARNTALIVLITSSWIWLLKSFATLICPTIQRGIVIMQNFNIREKNVLNW